MSYALSTMEEHFRINVEKKLFVKAPEQEDFELTPATRLLEKRREMIEVENGLNQQKDEFSMKMDSLKQRRDELSRKESQLKDSLLKFDKFLKENNVKRTRALKKSVEERKAKEQKEVEIVSLKENMNLLGGIRDKQGVGIEKNVVYQRYLESIISLGIGEEFGEVKDILARFDTLSATNHELIDRARLAQEKTEEDRANFVKSVAEKNNVILNDNNEIAKLQARFEELQLKTAKLEAESHSAFKTAAQRTLLLGQMKMATNNLFQIVKAHLNNRLSNTTEPIDQLERISQFIIDLEEIKTEMLKDGCTVGSN